jgi:hypothetical protein
MSGQTPYVLQELIGIKNEIGNVTVREAASIETYQNTIFDFWPF